ncbi:hypothetical protein IQ268_24105 [Oculatella sp. LEGE 06141]|uniref:hypothetical protein n=1 Tax=Oculatella sp. LEGE 06141 TaxID=1828648 RepID=UPI001881AAD6|nr:hypothetical protein [Oculatella sp. LEGE 06141]MBE9181652.1 hypothetical protein [Oculatella sp. LEGE 06141]
MPRLNDRAFDLLSAEIQRLTGDNAANQVRRDIVIRRLERLRTQQGQPASVDELRDALSDIFPDFDQQVLDAAARANGSSAPAWWQIKLAAIAIVGLTGGLYILNLPYPMIRRPVARVAPIVLLPSYLSMDYNYRQAISLVEQADQLVNQASSLNDFVLGDEKVKQAQKHLDALPVWFLGYEPQRYCSFFSCSFLFTIDEFRAARASIGRMEAKIFQEKNAQTALDDGETALNTAKQQYREATTQPARTEAIAAWQVALDSLQQVPEQTLAGRSAQTKLIAHTRDFQLVAGLDAGSKRSNTLIEVAKEFAIAAANASQNPPHPAERWEQMAGLWQEAIARLDQIPLDDPGYVEAQRLLVSYQTQMGTVQMRWQAEKDSVQALTNAKNDIPQLLEVSTSASDRANASQLQRIINQLSVVQPGTTAYEEAQSLLQSAQNKLRQLQ